MEYREFLKKGNHTNLVGVLELAAKARYGFTSRGIPIYLFVPWNEDYPPFYVGSSYGDRSTNVIAVVDFESWVETANCPRGLCRRILGPCGDLITEEEGLRIHTHPFNWKKDILYVPRVIPNEGGTHLTKTTFHVDPPGCRDIDDAISLWEEGDHIEIRIHIADVASLLSSNPVLWSASYLGETLYKDGTVISGLFPPTVEKECSLLPETVRQTLSLAATWSPYSGSITKTWWLQEEITVAESYTYETIVDSPWAPMLKAIASGLAQKEVSDSHDWIAEFMLFYNKEAAKILKGAGKGILRRHSEPDYDLLKHLELQGIAPQFLAFKAGQYCLPTDADVNHWGLNESLYCHASSPIRRWVDCINQAVIIQTLFVPTLLIPPYAITEINKQAKKVKSFERDLFFVETLLNNPMQIVKARSILEGEKSKLWVPAWNRCITIHGEVPSGKDLSLSIYINPSKRNWKRKIVVEIRHSLGKN